MALPVPIPDNPQRWDGWKTYNSPNPYERLCLDFDSNPSQEQVEENCRLLLVWWQKKLPLKNQPSNPMAQLLRAGLDEAPKLLAEARTQLLDGAQRSSIDAGLRAQYKEHALLELKKFLKFSTADGQLTPEAEESLQQTGIALGLRTGDVEAFIEAEITASGVVRSQKPPVVVTAEPVLQVSASPGRDTPEQEFRRLLRLSGLSEDDLTDDQRDAFCNMGENLGLTGGQAEDLIDEYLESTVTTAPMSNSTRVLTPPAPKAAATVVPAKASEPKPIALPTENRAALFTIAPLQRVEERARFPGFTNHLGQEMLLITSGIFAMGSELPEAAPNERPLSRTRINCFHMARHPVTNAQYEQFQPSHRSKRAPWSNDQHPAVYVNALEAAKFCEWLSGKERKRYRLPTEAEWEYAARASEIRPFPWGGSLNSGAFANFADANTSFPWSMPTIDDGYAQSSPVGSFPRGASPFGVEDMAGNVWEWCADGYADYKGRDQVNPRVASSGPRQIYRGGSWKSRINSLRTTARGWNAANFSSNDVGFRVVCECE